MGTSKRIPGCFKLLSKEDNHTSYFSLAQEQKGGEVLYAKRGTNSRLKPRPEAKLAQQSLAMGVCKSAGVGEWGEVGWENQLTQPTCSWLSLLLQGRRCLPRPILKAWTQSGFKEAGAPWVPGEWGQTKPERVLSCDESPSSSLHSVLPLQQWLRTFVPIAASWSALAQAGTEPGVLLPNSPAAQPGSQCLTLSSWHKGTWVSTVTLSPAVLSMSG